MKHLIKTMVLVFLCSNLVHCQGNDTYNDTYNGSPIPNNSDSIICKYSHISRIELELPNANKGIKNKQVSTEHIGKCGIANKSECTVLFYDLKNSPKIMQEISTLSILTNSEVQKIGGSQEEGVYLQIESNGEITVHRIDYGQGSIVTTRNANGLNLLYGDSGWVNFGICVVNDAEAEKMKQTLSTVNNRGIEKLREDIK